MDRRDPVVGLAHAFEQSVRVADARYRQPEPRGRGQRFSSAVSQDQKALADQFGMDTSEPKHGQQNEDRQHDDGDGADSRLDAPVQPHASSW